MGSIFRKSYDIYLEEGLFNLTNRVRESLYHRLLKITARIRRVTALIVVNIFYESDKEIWIFGANKGKRYADNSKVLFEYVYNNLDDITPLFITDLNDNKNIDKRFKKSVLRRNSIYAEICILKSKFIFLSHGWSDVSEAGDMALEDPISVYLEHGIWAFGRLSPRCLDPYDLVVSANNTEAKIKSNNTGKDERNIMVTGLPRHDVLAKPVEEYSCHNAIMLMPTGRPWLKEGKGEYEYIKNVRNILDSNKIKSILKENNLLLYYCPHINISHLVSSILTPSIQAEERIILVDSCVDVQEIIRKSDCLITDYSSVAWEFVALKKDVIFYQWDLDRWKKNKGSYVYPDELGFSCIPKNIEQLINSLSYYTYNRPRCTHKSYNEIRNKWTPFLDKKCCDRVIKRISLYK